MSNRLEGYDPTPFIKLVEAYLKKHGTTMRAVSLKAGMNASTLANYMRGIRRPHRDSCFLLAETMGIDPNELLLSVGYPPLPVLDRSLINPEDFPPDVKAFANELRQIAPLRRKEIMDGLRELLKAEWPAAETT